MIRIAVDGMGGDFAPQAAVKGAMLAAQEYPLEVVIVGHESIIKRELEKYKATKGII